LIIFYHWNTYGTFYPRKGLFLYHFQKNKENPDLKIFLSPIS